jgi:hypothetical protein
VTTDATWLKTKGPNEKLDYVFDFSAPESEDGPWLAVGESITAATITSSPAGLTITLAAFTATEVSCRIAAGTLGATYYVVVHATTSAGQEPERTLRLRIVKK